MVKDLYGDRAVCTECGVRGAPWQLIPSDDAQGDANSGRKYPAIPDGASWPETIRTGDEKVYGTMRVQGPLDPSTSQLTVGFDDVRGSPEGTTIYVPHVYLLPR